MSATVDAVADSLRAAAVTVASIEEKAVVVTQQQSLAVEVHKSTAPSCEETATLIKSTCSTACTVTCMRSISPRRALQELGSGEVGSGEELGTELRSHSTRYDIQVETILSEVNGTTLDQEVSLPDGVEVTRNTEANVTAAAAREICEKSAR